jgi:hypothetical protein
MMMWFALYYYNYFVVRWRLRSGSCLRHYKVVFVSGIHGSFFQEKEAFIQYYGSEETTRTVRRRIQNSSPERKREATQKGETSDCFPNLFILEKKHGHPLPV